MIAHAFTIATASCLVLAATLRAGHCARTTLAGIESEALAEQAAADAEAAAAEATIARHACRTRAAIWTARVDRQLAPPRLSDYAAAQAYLEAAAHYHRAAMRHPSTPVAFTAAADTLGATTTAPTEARQC